MSETIRITCDLPNHDGEWVDFRRGGWTFGVLREWETSSSSTDLAVAVCQMIHDWNLTNGDTHEPVPFAGKNIPKDASAEERRDILESCLDNLDPTTASWVVGVFRLAYHQAALPDPKAS